MQQPLWPHTPKLPDIHPESQRLLHHPVMEAGKLLGKVCFTDSLAVSCKAAYSFHSAVVPLLFFLHCRAFLLRISMPKMSEMTWSFYFIIYFFLKFSGVLGVSVGKESACDAGDEGGRGSVSGSGRSPAGENGNPLHYSCLENSMERGAWRVVVHGVTKSRTRLSD